MNHRARRLLLAVSLAIAAISGFGAWDFYMKQKGHIDDDDFYFLWGTAEALKVPHRYRELSTTFIDRERTQGYPEYLARNLELKRDYAFNYALVSAVYLGTDAVSNCPLGGALFGRRHGRNEPLDPWVLRQGFLAAFVVSFGAVCWLLWRIGDVMLGVAFAGMVALCAYWATTWTEAGDQRFVYLWLQYPSQLSRHVTNFFVNPRWYSFLHNGPRATFIVVLLGVFVLRWSGRLAASYWWLMAAVLSHGSNGLMVTAFLVAIDAVSHPRFYTARTLLPASMALVLAAATESVWPSVLFRAGTSARAVAVVLLAIAGGGVVWWSARRSAGWLSDASARYVTPALSRIERIGRPQLDVFLLIVLWVVLFVAAVLVSRYSSGYQQLYFWEQANGRLLAILQPVLIMGILLAVLRGINARLHDSRAMVVMPALLLVLMLPVAVSTLWRGVKETDKLMPDLLRRVPAFEAQVQTPPLLNRNRDMPEDELTLYVDYRFYYALARSLHSGVDYVSPLVGEPPRWRTGK